MYKSLWVTVLGALAQQNIDSERPVNLIKVAYMSSSSGRQHYNKRVKIAIAQMVSNHFAYYLKIDFLLSKTHILSTQMKLIIGMWQQSSSKYFLDLTEYQDIFEFRYQLHVYRRTWRFGVVSDSVFMSPVIACCRLATDWFWQKAPMDKSTIPKELQFYGNSFYFGKLGRVYFATWQHLYWNDLLKQKLLKWYISITTIIIIVINISIITITIIIITHHNLLKRHPPIGMILAIL